MPFGVFLAVSHIVAVTIALIAMIVVIAVPVVPAGGCDDAT